MSFQSFMQSKFQKLDWLDLGLIKWSCIAFGILLVMLFPVLLDLNLYLILVIVLVLGARPAYRAYIK